MIYTPTHSLVSYGVYHFLEELLVNPFIEWYHFRVTRVALSTLQLRSSGEPSLPSSALPRVLSRLSALSRFILPTLPHFLHPGLSNPPLSIPRPCSCIPAARLSRAPKQAADTNSIEIDFKYYRYIFIYKKWLSFLTIVSSRTQCVSTMFSKKLYQVFINLFIEHRFQVTPVALSTPQLHSRGGISLSFPLPALRPLSFPSSFVLSVSLPPSFPASLPPFQSIRPSSLYPPSIFLHRGGSIESNSKASS